MRERAKEKYKKREGNREREDMRHKKIRKRSTRLGNEVRKTGERDRERDSLG